MPFASKHNVSMSTCFQKSVPKLYVDHFDGDPKSRMKWYSIFQATIDRALMISSENLIHLQSLLTGEAKALLDGYGCNGDLYASALHRFQEHLGNPERIINAFLEKLNSFKSPNLSHPKCYIHFSSFLFTMVDTFQQLGFVHDLLSTTNLNVVLAKLPNRIRLEWNKFVLEKDFQQPSLQILSDCFLNYSKAYRDSNSSHNCGKKHDILLHDSFAIKSGSKKSNVKILNLQGTGQIAVVPLQLKNSDKVLGTNAYLDSASCQSLLLRSTATNLNLNMNTIGKMPNSGYHMTREIDFASVKLQIRPLKGEQSFEQKDKKTL